MENTKLIKFSFIIALILALGVFGVALAEGEGEPTSPDCAGKINVFKVTDPVSSDYFDFTVNREGSASDWKTFQINGVTGTNEWAWWPSTTYDFGRYYTVTETMDSSELWRLTDISCSAKYNDSTTLDIPIITSIADDGKSGYASFVFEDYYYVTCTFTNEEMEELDYGDLPESGDINYGMTTYANNGARHVPGDLFLGSGVDGEYDGQPSQLANGDDINGTDDEDGGVRIANPPDYWMAGAGAVDVTVGGSGYGCLSAWMDVWNSNTNDLGADGDFDDSGVNSGGAAWSENIIVNQPVQGGQTYTFNFNLPNDSGTYNMYARFRLVPDDDGVCEAGEAPQLTGLVNNGEVEDYVFLFENTAISLKDFSASPFNTSAMIIIPAVLGVGLLGAIFGARKKS